MKISKWLKNMETAMMEDGLGYHDDFVPDNPPCPDCGSTMSFYGHDDNGDFPIGEGYWLCPSCGKRIGEDELNFDF